MTDAQLVAIAEQIFVMRERTRTSLPKPTFRGPAPFKTALDAIGAQHDFQNAGLAVIDFTNSRSSPDVWLHNGDRSFRVGSASKIAMMLAAVQLRLDVRAILDLTPRIISTAAEFDALYANRKLWSKAKVPRSERPELLQIAASPPLISQIFDFAKTPVDFFGPDPNGQTTAPRRQVIMDKLPARALGWARWSDLEFSERLWLTGCKSDDVAAATCVSQIGVPYIKAVQRAYGLADTAHGMHLLATGGYAVIPPRATPPAVAPPRQLTGVTTLRVKDAWWDDETGDYTDEYSVVPGSAVALAAYMIALMTDSLVNDGSFDFGLFGCTTIRNNLADGGAHALPSNLVEGVKDVPNTVIRTQLNKIGILGKGKSEAIGAKAQIICEFVYLETQQVPAPPAPHRESMKYAVVAVGLISEYDATPRGHSSNTKAKLLGEAVHRALLALRRT